MTEDSSLNTKFMNYIGLLCIYVHRKNILNAIVSFVCIVIFLSCSKNQNPSSIPQDARYDKRTNSYVLVANGQKKIWNEHGELFSEEGLDEVGRSHGEYKSFFPSTGSLLSKGNFKNGEREGVWEWYFPNGKIYYKSGYSSERKRQVWIETNLLGNEHGIHERYYPNGRLEERGKYDFGLKTGYWEKFYKNGNFEHDGNYESDKKIGKWLYLYPDGKKEAEEEFSESGKLIYRNTYFPDGTIECIIRIDSKKCNKLK